MEFCINSINGITYKFKLIIIDNNLNVRVVYVNKNGHEYIVDKIVVTNNCFSVIFNTNDENQEFLNIKEKLHNLPFQEIVVDETYQKILEDSNILISTIPRISCMSQKRLYKLGLDDHLLDETHFIRTLIDLVASTRLAEIAIVLNNCQKQFYDVLQGDKDLKEKYLLFINYYNSSELTQKLDQKTKAAHYLLAAYIFVFYNNFGKEINKLDKLFEISLENVIAFFNAHINSSKEQLFFAVQNELGNSTPILKLVP